MANRQRQRHPAADTTVFAANDVRTQIQRPRLALVVDPDAGRRRALMAMLEVLGFSVLSESDMDAALQTCWRELPHLVIVHVEAAAQNGSVDQKAASSTNAAAIIARFMMLPKACDRIVIGCLSRHDASTGVRLLLAGARDCLVCPVDVNTLRQRLLLAGVLDGQDTADAAGAERSS